MPPARLILLVLLTSGGCTAENRWDRLATLPTGVKINVEAIATPSAQRVRLIRVEQGRVIVQGGTGSELALERAEIRRITRRSRIRGLLIGMAAGFAIGFPVGAAAGPYIADHGFPSAAKRAQFGLGLGIFTAGIGAGAGALAGSRQTLYP